MYLNSHFRGVRSSLARIPSPFRLSSLRLVLAAILFCWVYPLVFVSPAVAVDVLTRDKSVEKPDSAVIRSASQAVIFESDQARHYAKLLISQKHYPEAIAYLRTALSSMLPSASRLSLLLMLADAQMDVGDVLAATETLGRADLIAATRSQQRAVDKRHRRLGQMPLVPFAAAPYDSIGQLIADSLEAAKAIASQKLISNSFFETDIHQALSDLAASSGVPIVCDNSVLGTVTYEAKNQPLEDVLKAILMPAGYNYTFKNGTYYVGTGNPKDASFSLLSKTEAIPMANIAATEAIGLLSDYFKPYVKASESSNMVVVTGSQAVVDRLRGDLMAIDKPQPQILIEVAICEFAVDALRKLGLDWSIARTGNPQWNISAPAQGLTDATLSGAYTETQKRIAHFTANLTASLEAMESSGDAKIRAEPRITTLNGHSAQISLTTDQYFVIQTGTSQSYAYNTLQSVSSGIKLKITPFVAASGEMTVYVEPEVGDVVGSGAQGLPEITRRTASTSVRVHDGQTFTVGGLNTQRSKVTQKKIPFLGDIPILGYLFRYDERSSKDTELVIFVTPHLLSR